MKTNDIHNMNYPLI